MILMSPPRIAAVLVAPSQSIPRLPEGLWEGGPECFNSHFAQDDRLSETFTKDRTIS